MITEKAPGKLYIAGEYAVVENGYPAVLVALDQFVTCTIKESAREMGQIFSRQYHNNQLLWRRMGDQMVVDKRDNPFSYILSAIKVTEEYARQFERELRIYDLQIDSQLDSQNGRKYGLGSSAAVTVATVKALCRFYNLPVTKDEIFKLAAIAHFEVQGNGSWVMWRRPCTGAGFPTTPLTGSGSLSSGNTWTSSPWSTSPGPTCRLNHYTRQKTSSS